MVLNTPVAVDNESLYPHSQDVLERESADDGFSRGWGIHFQPTERYIADIHGHIQFDSFDSAKAALERHMKLVRPIRITYCMACTPVISKPSYLDEPQGFPIPCRTGWDALRPYFDLVKGTEHFSLMLFLHYANPDVQVLQQSAAAGACAVKLHNAPIIVNAADPEIWLTDEWKAVFAEIERLGLPVLWHVTQRLTDSPYTGGGRNTYWKDGWKKGVKFTNEDLLQVFLKVVDEHPGIPFICAHQLHLGWGRLSHLFDRHPNLYTDTSIGCMVVEGDRMYEHDIRLIRDFFIQYCDRILFGTDYYITDAAAESILYPADEKEILIKNHIRFIKQLRLPDDVLQRVLYGNAVRILRLV